MLDDNICRTTLFFVPELIIQIFVSLLSNNNHFINQPDMKKFYLFFLLAALAVFSAKADVQIFTVTGTIFENPNINPVPGHPVTIEIPPSNVFDGYFNEVFTNESGEYIDEVEVPEALLQAEVFISTIDCNGFMMTEIFPFYQGMLNITCDFIICDEPFPDCWATFGWQPSPNDPFTMMFFDESFFNGNTVEWSWQFGDGSGSGEQNPVHTFGGAGIYPVCLTISTPDCEDTFCIDVNVGFIPPGCQAFFEWIPMEEQTIHFIDMSNPPPTTWLWDFGDNTFSDEPAPVHFYQQPGEYVVCLTIFDEQMNCEDTFCQDIWVDGGSGGDCQAYYTWWPMDDLTVEFLDLSNFEPGEWVWEFGDGQMSWEPNPVHNYGQPGVYPVCLTVYGENCMDVYCEEVIVEGTPAECHAEFWYYQMEELFIQFNNTSYPENSEFMWEFGDGVTSSEFNPVHQYQEQGVYEVCLMVFNPELNCEDMLCQEVWVGNNFECQASFDWVPLGDSAYVVQFFDTSIGPEDMNYFWEFGDGGTSEEQNPVHFYQETGFFEVCLTISSPDCQSVFCNEVYVEGYPWDCYADFSWQLDADMNVQFFDWSYPTPEEWLWDFGDGETSTEQNPSHQYFEPGDYEVCLHIYNSFVGCDEIVCNVVEVGIPGGLNASYVYTQDSTNFFTIYFFDTSSGNPVDWMWEFGDGTTANEQNPLHSFNGPGTYTVCLTIMDAAGQASTYCEDIILDGSYISGIDEPKGELQINRVFPNPANDFVNLEINSPVNSEVEVALINLQGKELKRSIHSLSTGENAIRLGVSGLPEGVYLIRLQNGSSTSTTKIKVSK
jgi:PKD repeat protein